MSKRCARCDKAVYPIEELKCLDKIWHKGCFKCQECGMTLSMKTYKGFNKLPYCEAHIPKAKATTVAETPEMKRLAENTKNQSNVQYHADFEKNKARFTQVADDPETMRIKQNTKNISNVTYHGDLEKKAIMEQRRTDGEDGVSEPMSQPLPQVVPEQKQITSQPVSRVNNSYPNQTSAANSTRPQQPKTQYYSQPTAANPQNMRSYNAPYYAQSTQPPQQGSQYSQQSYPTQPQNQHPAYQQHQSQQAKYPQQNMYHNTPPSHLYQDPNHNSPYSSRNSQTLIYSSQTGPIQQANQNVGSISDYDPMNNQYGSVAPQKINSGGYRQEETYQTQRGPQMYQASNNSARNHMHAQQMHHKVNAPPTNLGRCFRAVYDYEAADTDEISFKDGDLIINCTSIDEGWMTGTVQRTGRTGMLPANYVDRAN